jgi:hypothetical protein
MKHWELSTPLKLSSGLVKLGELAEAHAKFIRMRDLLQRLCEREDLGAATIMRIWFCLFERRGNLENSVQIELASHMGLIDNNGSFLEPVTRYARSFLHMNAQGGLDLYKPEQVLHQTWQKHGQAFTEAVANWSKRLQ